jgi:CDP-diacylglycerol--glycerol-3-phosphate 3-phosphatidyltransferase
MTVPNALTISRLILSPVFFLAYFIPLWIGDFESIGLVVMVVAYLIIEISDVLDGYVARSRGLVTDIGKLMDPFADVISRLTYFVCFAFGGIMPVWALMVILYREFGILFLRMIMYTRGTALAARGGGKLKATFYALGGLIGVLVVTTRRGVLPATWEAPLSVVAIAVYSIAAVLAVVSFVDYVRVFVAWRSERDRE